LSTRQRSIDGGKSLLAQALAACGEHNFQRVLGVLFVCRADDVEHLETCNTPSKPNKTPWPALPLFQTHYFSLIPTITRHDSLYPKPHTCF